MNAIERPVLIKLYAIRLFRLQLWFLFECMCVCLHTLLTTDSQMSSHKVFVCCMWRMSNVARTAFDELSLWH